MKDADGSFRCRFFLHGWRHLNADAQKRIDSLRPQETVYVTLEVTNPATGLAAQIQTEDYYMIGWSPRYIAFDLAAAMAEAPDGYQASVVRLNPLPAPSKQRVLIEMRGRLGKHEPMNGSDFIPLVP